MLCAIIASWAIVRNRQRSLSLSDYQRGWLGFAAFVGAMIGAKMPFLMELGWEGLASGTIWFTDGKTILGGIFGGYAAIEVAKYFLRIRVSTGDSFALPVAVAVFMGRIGCFVVGCCYGKVTEQVWGVHFPTAGDADGILRHPTQLYEAAFHAIAALFLVLAHRYKLLQYQQLKAYLLAYLAFRFATETLRPEPVLALGLSSYQWASIVLAACLAGLWLRDARRIGGSRELLDGSERPDT